MIASDQINLIAQIIAEKFDTTSIILFGSHAKGEAGLESDLDLCITTRLGNNRKIELMRAIRREIYDLFSIPIDLLIYDDEEFQQRAAHHNTLEYKIQKTGILLNGQ
jgi:predicted nucleotidyltransferase